MTTIQVEIDKRGVATVTLARPEKHNAINAEMIDDLIRIAMTLGQAPEAKVIVLTGQGRSFCSGADLSWMRAMSKEDHAARVERARALARMFGLWYRLSKPLICRLQGSAFGGGLGLAAICDVCVGGEGARFGFPEVRHGLIPATIAPYVVARIGVCASRRWMLAGRAFDAGEAYRLGLLDVIVASAELDAAVEAEVADCLLADVGATASCKEALRELAGPIDEALERRTAEQLAALWREPEATRRLKSFHGRGST